ncbi:hypothetical protein [Streptomyces albus]|uniref:hypothetical protein n=1 Tax=Streptomyces albus TaxID=1888 RepID=UPI00345367D3
MTTHNGRGQDGTSGSAGDSLPASTTPYEGVVLPANGEPWTPQQQRQVQAERDRVQPPAGRPWGDPWGPEAQPAPGLPPQEGPDYWGPPQSTDGTAAGPLPDAGTSGGGSGALVPGGAHDGPPHAQPLPPEGTPARPPHPPSVPPVPGTAPGAQAPPYPGAMPPAAPPHPGPGPMPPQPAGGPGPLPQPGAAPGQHGPHAWPQPDGAAPRPPEPPAAYPGPPPEQPAAYQGPPAASPQPEVQQLPPQPGGMPGGIDSDATQLFPPFPSGDPHGAVPPGAEDGTQLLPPQPGGPVGSPDSEATQYLPPVPDAPDSAAEATQVMSPVPPADGEPDGKGPLPEFENLFRSDSRSSGPGAPPAGPRAGDEPGSTQSLPVFDEAAAPPPAPPRGGYGYPPPGAAPRGGYGYPQQAPPAGGYGYPQPGSAPRGGYGYPQPGAAPRGGYGYPQQPPQPGGYGYPQPGSQQHEQPPGGRAAARRGGDRGRRGVPTGVLVGGGLAGVAAIGLVVGLLMADSGGGKPAGDKPQASTEPAGEKASPPPDPAEEQAKKLDALLADSNNSRSAVVRSVENIRTCKALDKAATDLRTAAEQRTGLVRRLGELKTDKIPDSGRLNAALKSAWKASASADNHYAAWADQVAGKKGCHKGKARHTRNTVLGNRASGTATTAKKQAAELWNPTARKYGLTERQFGQL